MMLRLPFLIGAAALSLAGCQTTTAARPTTWEQVQANRTQQYGAPAACKCMTDNLSKSVTVERCIRPVALGRKNSLFAGSEGGGHRWAMIASLVETCKLNGVEPFAYLRDVLERMVNGYPASRLADLLPWNWKPDVNA